MKIKIDENLPAELADLLRPEGHEVDSVADEGLSGQADDAVAAAVRAEGRLLVTQDLDFSDARRFAPGTHPGVVILRLREPSRRRLLDRFQQAVQAEPTALWARCLVVITDQRVRILRP